MLQQFLTHAVLKHNRPGHANNAAKDVTMSDYNANTVGRSTNENFAHLQPLERKIVDFIISQGPPVDGVHVANIARAVGTDAKSIRSFIFCFGDDEKLIISLSYSDALDRLMDEGTVFSTIDESHFSVISN